MKRLFTLITILLFKFSMLQAQVKPNLIDWIPIASLKELGDTASKGLAGPIVGIVNNTFFIGGGANFLDKMPWEGGKKNYYSKLILGTIHHNSIQFNTYLQLPEPIAYAAVTQSNNAIFYAGGETQNGTITNKVFKIKPSSNENDVEFVSLPNLPLPLANAAMLYCDDKLYIVGGESSNQTESGVYMLKLNSPTPYWEKLGELPYPISHAVVGIKDNKLYIAGGRMKQPGKPSIFHKGLISFDLCNFNWAKLADLPMALAAGTGYMDSKGYLWVFGGDSGHTFNQVEKVLIQISTETDAEKKKDLLLKRTDLQSNHPGFNRNILKYNCKKNNWSIVGELPFQTNVTTTAIPFKKGVLIPSGEIKPGIRTPEIYYGKF